MRASTVLKGLLLFLTLSNAQAQNARYASEQRANAAVTYYSRARTMLVEALAEYEQGRRYAQPNMIHDPEEFRLELISLTEELNRLVDPHIKITRDGVRVKANPRMIRRERDRLPQVVDGAQDASDVGERRRKKELKEARARMYAPKEEQQTEEPAIEEKKVAHKEATDMEKKESVDKIIEEAVEEKSEEISTDSDAPAPVESAKEEANSEKETTSGKVVEQEEAVAEEKTVSKDKEEDMEMSEDKVETEPAPTEEKASASKEQDVFKEVTAKDMEVKGEGSSSKGEEDEAVSSAIEKTIQDRLKNLEVGLDGESAE